MTEEKMKQIMLDLLDVQAKNITSEYMRGLYNGLVVAYNSLFNENKECKKNDTRRN